MQDARILVVEDDALIVKDIRLNLEALGVLVVDVTDSGREALTLAGELRPDLVIMDILLPGDMDGIQTATRISQEYDIPIIYLTAYVDQDLLQRAKITDPLGYVLKPYTQRELQAVIALALHRAKNERSLQAFFWGSNICDNVQDAVIAVDTDLHISLLNPQAMHLLGVESEYVQGKPWNEAVLNLKPLKKFRLKSKLKAAATKGSCWDNAAVIALGQGDQQVFVMASIVPVVRLKRHLLGAMLILRDVTDQVRSEEKVRSQATQMAQYIEVSGAMLVALDLDGKITLANPAACTVLGYVESELLGQDWFETCIPSRLRKDARSLYNRIIKSPGEHPSQMEARVLARAGEERLIYWNLAALRGPDSAVVGGFGSGVDVTERRRLEIAIERSRDFYLSLMHHLPILVWRSNQLGQYDYFNEAWLTFTGTALRDNAGNRWLALVHPDDATQVKNVYEQAFECQKPFSRTYRLRTHKGEYHTLIDNAQPIYDLNGRFAGYIGGCVDIEGERQAERNLRRLSRALRVLSQANETLIRAGSDTGFLQSICNIIVEGGGYRMAWVGLAEQDQRHSVRPVAASGITLESLAKRKITWADDKHGQGPTGRAIRMDTPAIMREPSESSYQPWRKYAEAYGYQASVALPLRIGADVIGALNIYAAEPDAFDEEELRLLVNLADDLSFGLDVQHKQQALRDLTLRNETILRAVREGFWVLSFEHKILEVNDVYCALTGYSRDELLCMQATDMSVEAFVADMRAHLNNVKQQGYDCFETCLKSRAGKLLDVEISATLAQAGEDSFIFAFVRDIASRKRAEKALLENEVKYRALFEVANDAIFLMQDKVFVDCNKRTLAMYGCSREQIIGKTPSDISSEFQSDGRASDEKAIELLSSAFSGEPVFFEWRCRRFDGQLLDVEVSLNRVRISGQSYVQAIVRDITERKAAERALADAHHHLEALYQASPDMIFLHASDGRLVDVNQNALREYGYTFEEMLKLSISDLSAADYSQEQAAQLLDRVLAGESLDREWVARRKDGSEFPVEVRLRKLPQEYAAMQAALVAVVRDLSAVRRVEAQLRAILDYSPALISTKDLKGRITLASCQFEVLSEGGAADVIGKNVHELFPKDVAEVLWENDQRAIVSGQPVQAEETMRHLDGSEHTYLTVKFPLLDALSNQPFAVGAISTDITARKEAERVLKQERDFSEAVLNTIGSVVVVMDRSGAIVRFNDAAQQLTGYTEGEMIGQYIWDRLLAPEQIGLLKAVFDDLSIEDLANQYINYWLTKNGEQRLLDWNNTILTDHLGKVKYVIATGIDITERLLAQEGLARVETQWNHAIDFFADPLYFVDLQDRVVRANAAFYKLTGSSPEQVIGRNIAEIMHPQGEKVPCPVCAARRAQQDALIVMEAGHPDNPLKDPVEITVRMIRDRPDSPPTGILLSLRNLSRQREIEAELRKHRDHLEELVVERTHELEAVNRELEAFSYSVSHDLRAPLRSVDGFSQVLAEEYTEHLDERGRDYLCRLRAASQRMGHLIDDLLMLSRVTRQDLHRQHVDLGRVAQVILDALQSRDSDRKVRCQIHPDMHADVDVRLVRILFENLLGNAWKFTSREALAEIEFGSCVEQGETLYFIRDNGAGFDMAFAERMFDAFHRLHSEQEFEGTGVGLATAQRIVHRHGGRIYAQGQTGKGATLFFSLSPGHPPQLSDFLA